MNVINYFNPLSEGFNQAKDDFHDLSGWQQTAAVAASIAAGILSLITVVTLGTGAFAAFRWTVEQFTKHNNEAVSVNDDEPPKEPVIEDSDNTGQRGPDWQEPAESVDALSRSIIPKPDGQDLRAHAVSELPYISGQNDLGSGGPIDLSQSQIFGQDDLGSGGSIDLSRSHIPISTRSSSEEIDIISLTSNPIQGRKPVRDLIGAFDAQWNKDLKKFNDLPFDVEEVSSLLEEHNRAFQSFMTDENENYGIIYKQDLPKDSKIFVRADLHGDLKSLLENLKELQKQGLLDENYKCKPNVQLVFLGDYMDRGQHAMEIAQILVSLRLENFGQIHLLRGNHEDIFVNQIYGASDNHLMRFVKDDEKSIILSAFYETMPLSVYLGEEGSDQKEYIQFSHALFEIKVDPSIILDDSRTFAQVAIPKKLSLAERVSSIKVDGFDSMQQLPSDKEERRRHKTLLAAQRVQQLAIEEERGDRSDGFSGTITAYQWADVDDNTWINSLGQRRWALSPIDIKHCFRLASTKHKVKMLFRGHQHYFKHHCVKRDKVIVSTLPVGMDSPYKDRFFGQKDRAYILDVKPKVKSWTKQAITRESGESVSEISEPVGIRESKV